ncbi:MAG: malate dehydrogenase [Euryarchaeota archaeon]|nr:malate dehydrogenase [Euryarchaeota archaeon]MDE1835827.1 malate dehydrogenase [Euryarchaeota archaeon]MDE1880522.1 malate dehydrogenase [Euryarchaeota archaeon]MDE2045801.1 malate dehydrogenase [Thermoplasmata archaeon]
MAKIGLSKICVIGAGNIGGTLAQRLAETDVAGELVLFDIVEGLPQGKALDIQESAPVMGFSTRVWGSTRLEEAVDGSDLVILTAGLARKPGMSRSDLLSRNAQIVKGHAEAIRAKAPEAVVIVVTNPVDVMAYYVRKVTGFPRERVIAESGALDSARFRWFVADALGVTPRDVIGFTLGTHGDTMVPVLSHCSVNGVPVTKLLPPEKLKAIVERTKKGGGEIVDLLKTGSAFYAPSAAQLEMALAVARDEHRLLSCSVQLDGEYGFKDVFLSVPVIIGRSGISKIHEIDLSSDEQTALEASAKAVSEDLKLLATMPL